VSWVSESMVGGRVVWRKVLIKVVGERMVGGREVCVLKRCGVKSYGYENKYLKGLSGYAMPW